MTTLQDFMEKPSFLSLTSQDITDFCAKHKFPKFRAEQLIQWIFIKKAESPEQMTNIPKALRAQLAEDFSFAWPEVVSKDESADGATKLLLKTEMRNQVIEAVILRYENRVSLCVSSQVGCKLACTFCQTGKLGFFRNLKAHEIVAQYRLAQSIVEKEGRNITHMVFMGMGEPLDNFPEVVKALQILVKDYGLSKRRVTLSTSGIAPKIKELADILPVNLALSLHACEDELRTSLMPINRRYSLEEVKKSLVYYQNISGRKITLEYILIKDQNIGIKHAKALIKFIHGLKAKVNLIPFNPHPGLEYEAPSLQDIEEFQSYLVSKGVPAPVRYSKGQQVSAACGQLAAKKPEFFHDKPERKMVVNAPAL